MPISAARKVAAFDFDGTLARGDSLMPFLVRLIGGPRLARSVLNHALPLARIGLGKGNRDETKERFIAHALKGHPDEQIHELGASFAESMLETRMFAGPMARAAWHRDEGHELVLVSASLDVYLQPLARLLGFDHTITTELEIRNGVATGRLVGGNVRAAAKARLLSDWLGSREDVELWSYGNSSGDYELLELADHPLWVDRRGQVSPWSGR